MATYLVTGGAGFIGSHLCDALLAQGHGVRVLDDLSTGKVDNLDPRVDLDVGDAADPFDLWRVVQGVDGIFHLAAVASVARSNEDWLGTHRANLTATITVMDAARSQGRIPVVYASSAAIYGNQGEGAIRETATPAPSTAYGADKLGSELHAAVAAGVHGVPTCGFRFFNVYGPRQDPASPYSGVISIFADRIARGAPITVNGDGGQTRDFIFVADIVAHLLAGMRVLQAAPAARALVLNACTGHETNLLGLVAALGRVVGRIPEVSHGPARPGDIRASLGSPERAIAELGVAAKVSIEDGLRALIGAR